MDTDVATTNTLPRHVAASPTPWEPFPDIDLRQLHQLTDDTGIFQHALYSTPDPNHGYCIDDNARALIAALLHAKLRSHDERVVPMQRYLAFLAYAFNEDRQAFRNFMSYDRQWLEEVGSQDSQGRTIWALGLTVRLAPDDTVRGLARSLMDKGLPAMEKLEFLRSWTFALIGLDEFLKHEADHGYATELRDRYANKLFDTFREHATDDWPWWEDTVTYDNAKLPQALLVCGKAMRRADMIDAALKSLRWLLDIQMRAGHLSIIGNSGWHRRDGFHARFDQQPLEAYAMVHACLTAAEITGDADWANHAWTCFEWFRGRNDLSVPLYHSDTGGCQDGLQANGPNKNQGAESSLAYLLSVLELHLYRDQRLGRVTAAAPRTLGYAIAGAGRFASFCLENYKGIDSLRPVAVWNRTASKANKLAQEHDMTVHESLGDMLDDPDVDLVHVATTPAQHAELALAALRKGKHVLCEKPIATNLGDAAQMIQTAAERDLQLGVNFVMRYGPLAMPMWELVRSDVLGAPLRGSFTNRAGDGGLPPEHWFWNEQESGGIFVEHGVHFFDLVRAWLGEAQVIDALRLRRPDTAPGSPEIIDQVAADLRYGPQTTVNFYHGFHQGSHLDRQDFRIIFERGEAVLAGWIARELAIQAVLSEPQIEQLHAIFPDAELRTIEKFDGGTVTHRRQRRQRIDRHVVLNWRYACDKQASYGEALRALMEDLIHGIRDRRHALRVTADDGRAALELALGADRIARGMTP